MGAGVLSSFPGGFSSGLHGLSLMKKGFQIFFDIIISIPVVISATVIGLNVFIVL